jgi:roadblock/LC7 domain-containing protein
VAGSYGALSGTSMSCPLAAGVTSWIKCFNPSLSNYDAINALHAACDTMPDSLFRIGELGAGRVSLGNVILPLYYCDLRLEDWRFNDASGNGNGRPDPGENVALIVTYRNTSGWRDASSVWATVTCSGNGVVVSKDTARFPDIPNGNTGNCSADSFVITVPTTVPPQDLVFTLTTHASPDPAYPTSSFEVQCGEPRLLIVDDDEGSDYEKYYTGACDSNSVLYDLYSVQVSGSPSADTLRHYPVVAWFCGNDSTTTLTATDQTNLTSYLTNGGNLFISGQNIAQDIATDGFLDEYLHAQLVDDSTGENFVSGIPGDPITSNSATTCDTMVLGGSGGANNAKSTDGIRPTGGAFGCGYYKDYPDTSVQAVIRYAGAYKLVFFSCPFEAIDHSVSRYLQKWTLVARILKYFGERVPGVAQELPGPDINPYVLKVSPSPFNRQAVVEFIAPISGVMELRTFSADGRLVSNQSQTATIGQRMRFTLDGARLSGGIYLVQLVTPAGVYAQKTAVLK